MPQIEEWLPVNGVVGTSDFATDFSVTVTGTGQVLADESDATYLDFYNNTSRGTFNSVFADIADWTETGKSSIRVWVATKTNGAGAFLEFNLNVPGFGNIATVPEPITANRTEGAWSLYEFQAVTPEGFQSLTDARLSGGAFNGLHWYEAAVVVQWRESYDAPPARLFPRSDGLGVGGGRHFPPPKSQQRSSRRFGYY